MKTKNKERRIMSLDELKDRDLGRVGTPKRDKYELDLKMELGDERIKNFAK